MDNGHVLMSSIFDDKLQLNSRNDTDVLHSESKLPTRLSSSSQKQDRKHWTVVIERLETQPDRMTSLSR